MPSQNNPQEEFILFAPSDPIPENITYDGPKALVFPDQFLSPIRIHLPFHHAAIVEELTRLHQDALSGRQSARYLNLPDSSLYDEDLKEIVQFLLDRQLNRLLIRIDLSYNALETRPDRVMFQKFPYLQLVDCIHNDF